MFSLFFGLRFHRLLGLAALLIGEAPAQAASSPPLTLAEALARAVERNPALAAQSYGERAADALIEQASFRPNPTLEVGVENVHGTGRVQGLRSSETTLQASQTFERGGKRDKRIALASRERDVAAREFVLHRTEVLATTAGAYIATLAAQERVALAAESPRLAREIAAAIERHVQAGAASTLELARARSSLASAQAELSRAEAGLISARTALANTWGGASEEVTLLAGSLRAPETLPSPESFRAGLAAHPRLHWQAAVVSSRRASLALEQARAAGDITASSGVRFFREGSDAALVAGVSLPLPTRNSNQGNIRAARENLAAAEQTIRAVESEVRGAFAAGWQDLAAAHAAVQSLRREALPAAEEAYHTTRRVYEAGPIPLTEVLDAQRTLIAVRREVLAAESDYATALVRLEALANPAFPTTAALLSPR